MLLTNFLCDMHLSDFLGASLDQCNIQGLLERKKVIRLVNFIFKIWQFLRQNVANFSFFFLQNFHIFVENLGFLMAISRYASFILDLCASSNSLFGRCSCIIN